MDTEDFTLALVHPDAVDRLPPVWQPHWGLPHVTGLDDPSVLGPSMMVARAPYQTRVPRVPGIRPYVHPSVSRAMAFRVARWLDKRIASGNDAVSAALRSRKDALLSRDGIGAWYRYAAHVLRRASGEVSPYAQQAPWFTTNAADAALAIHNAVWAWDDACVMGIVRPAEGGGYDAWAGARTGAHCVNIPHDAHARTPEMAAQWLYRDVIQRRSAILYDLRDWSGDMYFAPAGVPLSGCIDLPVAVHTGPSVPSVLVGADRRPLDGRDLPLWATVSTGIVATQDGLGADWLDPAKSLEITAESGTVRLAV